MPLGSALCWRKGFEDGVAPTNWVGDIVVTSTCSNGVQLVLNGKANKYISTEIGVTYHVKLIICDGKNGDVNLKAAGFDTTFFNGTFPTTFSYQFTATDTLTTLYIIAMEGLAIDSLVVTKVCPILAGMDTAYRYRYNGKESMELLGGRYDYGARLYDGGIGKFLTLDPLTHKLINLSPYSYGVNSPISLMDADGKYPWPVTIRSLIATPSVALGSFRGDGRGPSFDGTARVTSKFTVDPTANIISKPNSESNKTIFNGGIIFAPSPIWLPPIEKRGTPNSSIFAAFAEGFSAFIFSHSGKDPITPSLFTPSLDVHAKLTFSEDISNGTLKICGSFNGDVFPSTEAFIKDQSGKGLFLGAKRENGDLPDLGGDNREKLFEVNMEVQFDKKGNFTGVRQGKNKYTVDQWNQKVKEDFKK